MELKKKKKRDTILYVRITKESFDKLEKMAKKLGMSIAQLTEEIIQKC